MLSATDHNYGITALHNYGFTVRLLPEKLENQNPLSAKIEIFKIKTLPPYSVAKLTRVPLGPSVPQQGNKIITHFQSKVSK
jgi:hypothetical protein